MDVSEEIVIRVNIPDCDRMLEDFTIILRVHSTEWGEIDIQRDPHKKAIYQLDEWGSACNKDSIKIDGMPTSPL